MAENRKSALLLMGLLSIVFAEVFSGSSPTWFLDPFGLTLTLTLYWSHTLFFLAIASRLHRTSVPHLYLWGTFFGLYESWVTKVLWAGFMGSTPIFDAVLGVAIVETLVLVLFWHPVFSFVIPVLVFELLSRARDPDAPILPGHEKWLESSRRNKIIAVVLMVCGGANLASGVGNDVVTALVGGGGSILLVALAYRLATRGGKTFSIRTVTLGNRGLKASAAYILIYYAVTFPLLRPEGIPGPFGIITVLLLYALFAVIMSQTRTDESIDSVPVQNELFDMTWLRRMMLLFIVTAVVMCLVPSIDGLLVLTGILSMVFVGPIMLHLALRSLFRMSDETGKAGQPSDMSGID
ncbi:MAG: hypothetical protein ACTSPE_07240 [Candidatus Thorarchaeota archaeon]